MTAPGWTLYLDVDGTLDDLQKLIDEHEGLDH